MGHEEAVVLTQQLILEGHPIDRDNGIVDSRNVVLFCQQSIV